MRRRHRIAFATCLAIACVLGIVPSALAAYKAPVQFGCGGFNSGGRDADGTHYMACGSRVLITPRVGAATTATLGTNVHHVAPSPDGSYVYGADANGLRRFRRTSATSYALDTSFRPERPAHWRADWRMTGFGVATDAYGNIYFSNGWGTGPAANQILKFRQDGTLVTWFGDYGAAGGIGGNPGLFMPNTGLAVSADGSRIWVADQNNQRVQFFDRRADNLSYGFAGMWSGEDTAWVGQLGATYDVAIDPWDRVYVTQTTTKNIWRLDRDGRNAEVVAHHRGTADATWSRPHTVSVDGLGRVYVGEWSQRFDPIEATPPFPTVGPEPRPDLQVPKLVSVVPAVSETTATSVRIDLTATDDIAVTQVGVVAGAIGDIRQATWHPYTGSLDLQLPVIGWNDFYVAVRDAAGRTSDEVVYVKVLRQRVPDTVAPTLAVSTSTTTTKRVVTLSVTTSDNVGVTQLRIAGDDGNYGPWMGWSSGVRALQHDLGSTSGTHTATVEVQDAAYNISTPVGVVVAFAVAPEPVRPVAVVVGGGAAPAAPVAATAHPRDTVAPRIRSVRVPRRSCSRIITIHLRSTDDRGLYWMRLANEDGRYGRWQRYRATVRHVLTRHAARKLVTVQVADAAGNVSRAASVRTSVVRCRR